MPGGPRTALCFSATLTAPRGSPPCRRPAVNDKQPCLWVAGRPSSPTVATPVLPLPPHWPHTMTVAQVASPATATDTIRNVDTRAPAPPAPTLVMVYGTLKKGFPNSPFLRAATYLGACRTVGTYPLVVGGDWFSPYLLAAPGHGHRVFGEMYAVCPAVLAALDELENVGVNYTRSSLRFVGPAGEVVRVHTYFKVNFSVALARAEYLVEYTDRRYVPRTERARYAVPPGLEAARRATGGGICDGDRVAVVGKAVAVGGTM
eukprot:TRINITY_DN2798_c0_g1_i1.p1 TRINITY_DN2798_c0_g1~~TRINITY_DN2798_c0_g1_i1.p1  ORF type:complete len:261 (+),score=61.25 TRINITY_DN2798_c0_g1_i1:453-1235(+)